MDITEEIFRNKRYKDQVDRLGRNTLILIAKDPVKALEAAQKGITQIEPEKINDVEYLQAVADSMQKLAQKVLGNNPIKS